MRIGELLVEQRKLRQSELARALQEKPADKRLCSFLIARGLVDFDDASRALGEQRGVACALTKHLAGRDQNAAFLIPAELGRAACALPIGRQSNGTVIVCVRDPSPSLFAQLKAATRAEVMMVIAPANRLENLVLSAYGQPPSGEFDIDFDTTGMGDNPVPPMPDMRAFDPASVRLALTDLDDARVDRDPSQSYRMVAATPEPAPAPAPPRAQTEPPTRTNSPSSPPAPPTRAPTVPPAPRMTPAQGVPTTRAATPAQGVPAPNRTTPAQGVPTRPTQVVAPTPVTPAHGVPVQRASESGSLPRSPNDSGSLPAPRSVTRDSSDSGSIPARSANASGSLPAMRSESSGAMPTQRPGSGPHTFPRAGTSAPPPLDAHNHPTPERGVPILAAEAAGLDAHNHPTPERGVPIVDIAASMRSSAAIRPPIVTAEMPAMGRTVRSAAERSTRPMSVPMMSVGLEHTTSREGATDLVLAYVATRWTTGLVFIVRDKYATGYRGHGVTMPELVSVPLAMPSTISVAVESRFLTADRPGSPAQEALTRALGEPSQLAAAPVLVSGQPVAVIVVGDVIDNNAESSAEADLGMLAESLSNAYTRLAATSPGR